MIYRIKLPWVLLTGLTLICGCSKPKDKISDTTAARPNIIFIMSDDHAYQAISCFGSKLIKTPNIDRIANEGIKFKNSFVTNSICAPSRAVLLTGKYSHKNGLRDNLDRFDNTQMTFPKLLQQAGYSTAIIGKWHLKSKPTGFDYWNVLIGQGNYYNPRMVATEDTVTHTGYTSDLITDFTIDYIEKRDTAKPFCVLYHHKAPHRNWMPKLEDLPEVLNKTYPLPQTFYDDYATRSAAREQDMHIEDMFLSQDMKLLPADYGQETGTGGKDGWQQRAESSWLAMLEQLTPEQRKIWDQYYDPIREDFRKQDLTGKALLEWMYQRYMQDYLGSVKAVDDNIGRLLDYLDDHNLSENTIVVYTSDQGFYLGEHGWYDKRFMYEESLRMPLVMRYPAAIKPGQVTDAMVLNLDFAPTLLDFVDVDIPSDMQGSSFRDIVLGKEPPGWRSSIYYHYYEYPHGWHNVKKHEGVRTDRYKLIRFYDDADEWELFDLSEDPNELNNLVGDPEYSQIKDELTTELMKLKGFYEVPHQEDKMESNL